MKATEQDDIDVTLSDHALNTVLSEGIKVRVSAPLLFRFFGKRTIKIVFKADSGGVSQRAGMCLLATGRTVDALESLSKYDTRYFNEKYSNEVYRCLACMLVRDSFFNRMMQGCVSRWLESRVSISDAFEIIRVLLLSSELESLVSCVRYVRYTKI